MYKCISKISLFLRTFIFPNPFEKYIELHFQNTIWSSSSSSIAYIFNLVLGGTLLWVICYPLVGIIYDRGEGPIVGSILYCILILINSKILVMITDISIQAFIIKGIFALIIEMGILFAIRHLKKYTRVY